MGDRRMARIGEERNPDNTYEIAIEWLKVLLAIVTMAALIAIYLLLPARGGYGLGLIRNLIPNIIATLLVVPAVFIVLTRGGPSLEDRIARAVRQAAAGTQLGPDVFPDDIAPAADLIRDIVTRKSKRRKVIVEMIAFTGGTFTTAVLRDLVNSNRGRLRIIVHSVDFRLVDASLLPPHWEQESVASEQRLQEICANRAELEVWHYPRFPFIIGLAIDDTDLFLAYPSWNLATGMIADENIEYRHYIRSDRTEHHFNLFENWANQPRQRLEIGP
jgi:hypothetical protein